MRLSTYSAPSFLLLCFVFLQAHAHTQDAHFSGFECFFCSACWQLRVAAVFFRGHEGNGGEGVQSPRLISCGCGAPRVTALSWAPHPIDGGMAGNFVAASWMDEGPLARVAGVVGARSVCVVW
ncbi:surface protease GP63 [Trypanosoma cruzi]|nr:surface protease GP63 [Trypanosoma cruzi]